MYKVFNMGIGMVVVISAKDSKKAKAIFDRYKIKSWVIGKVETGAEKVRLV